MRKPSDTRKSPRPMPGADESLHLVKRELRRRGLTASEIEATLRKKKRRRALEFEIVKSRNVVPYEAPKLPSDELCTVEFASSRLKLHPKTVLRFIRSGRLKATRIGKSYRIRRRDLETFAGAPPAVEAAPSAWVTSIVDIPGVDPETAQKWGRALPAALKGRQTSGDPIRVDIVYERERSHLKIVIVGDPSDTSKLLGLVRFWLEQLNR